MFGPRTFFKNNVFWLLFLVFGFPRCFCFWLRELLSATRTAKNQKTSRKPLKKVKNIKKNKDCQECLGQVFFCFWFSSLFFWFWFRKLLSATRTAKNQKTTQENQRNTRKTKKQRILRNVWAKDFVQMHCFCVFLVYFGFGLWKLVSATRTAKSQKNQSNTKKTKNTVFSGMSGPRTFFRGIVFLLPAHLCHSHNLHNMWILPKNMFICPHPRTIYLSHF